MTPGDWNTLVLMGTIFSVGGISALWLAAQFSGIRKVIYSEMAKHSKEDDTRFEKMALQLQRLELSEFGHSPLMSLRGNKPNGN